MADIVPFPVSEPSVHTVLVVDDEALIRLVLAEHLTDCGFKTLQADSADEAKRLIQSGVPVDLVFSDVRMPGTLDGFGLARWLMANHPEIPVLLASGDIGKINAATELCGTEVFAKPYDLKVAVQKITETITLHRQRRA